MLDLDMFIRWGQAMQRGEYIGLYPLPFAWIWAALSALPYPVLVFGVLLISLVLLIVLFRRRALFWMWYAPFIVTIGFGQLTMVWLGLLRLNRCGIDEWRMNRNTEAKQTTSRRWTISRGKLTA